MTNELMTKGTISLPPDVDATVVCPNLVNEPVMPAGWFSRELIIDIENTIFNHFGREISETEAQEIGLRLAQFTFAKINQGEKP